jgi:hypothetical protein
MELIDEALKNPKVKWLYGEVDEQTPITTKTQDDGKWTSATIDGKTTITASPTVRPAAALAHELLHAKLKISGYRQYLTLCSMDTEQAWLKQLCEGFDNELQHARMIDNFVRLGFEPDEFYHDDDISAFSTVRNTIRKMRPDAHPCKFLLQYLTVLAPGGAGSDVERTKLKNFFKAKCSQETWRMLQAIEVEFESWRTSVNLDVGPTLALILKHLDRFNQTWAGITSENFPRDGCFVDAEFTLEELVAWHKANASA